MELNEGVTGFEPFDEAARREVYVSSLPAPKAEQGTRTQHRSAVKVADVKAAVRKYYDLPEGALRSSSRIRAWAHPRQIAAYLSRELTGCSYPLIAREFGGRDHTTILFAHGKISKLRKENEALDHALDDLLALVLIERGRREEKAAVARVEIRDDLAAWEALGEA
jgi:hypothetical protein